MLHWLAKKQVHQTSPSAWQASLFILRCPSFAQHGTSKPLPVVAACEGLFVTPSVSVCGPVDPRCLSPCLQWQTIGDVDVDIGANPSAEDAEEGQDSSARKVIDIIESFRLVVSSSGAGAEGL